MKEALLYEKLDRKMVHCYLCNHHCRVPDQQFGLCVRQNVDGVLYTHAYAKVVAANVDPIEKKPLYHFLPGSASFSIATIGCNFRCGFCQNWEISQVSFGNGTDAWGGSLFPNEVVEGALRHSCRSISYTYTEPTIFFEYALETARCARGEGLRNVFVTNGYMTQECLKLIGSLLDAANVDLKFFSEEAYRKICAGNQWALENIRYMHDAGVWVEVTTLIVTGENDSTDQLSGIAHFLAGLDPGIPWHVSRFHPDYKFVDHAPTPEGSLKEALEIGKNAGLTYVYAGNVSGWGSDTYCPSCRRLLIRRKGFSIAENNLKENACAFCQAPIPGVFA